MGLPLRGSISDVLVILCILEIYCIVLDVRECLPPNIDAMRINSLLCKS